MGEEGGQLGGGGVGKVAYKPQDHHGAGIYITAQRPASFISHFSTRGFHWLFTSTLPVWKARSANGH